MSATSTTMERADGTEWPSELDRHLRSALISHGFERMTPVQAVSVPLILKRKDLAVEAVTGTGKTLAFLVPLLNWLAKNKKSIADKILALILSPTRELAQQTYDTLKSITQDFMPDLAHCLLIGGSPVELDVIKLKDDRPSIIVSTPGRMVSLLEDKPLNLISKLKTLEYLVLDEADRLLDLGFEKSVNTILDSLPKQRRTSLFSATQTADVQRLIRAGLRNPVCVTVKQSGHEHQRTPIWLNNYYTVCPAAKKFGFLVDFLSQRRQEKIIVFFNSGHCVIYFSRLMRMLPNPQKVYMMHRRVGTQRSDVFRKFSDARGGCVLFCTDLMSRGIDVPDVDWVIQFDPPTKVNCFIHRCGRTARSNRQGNALLMLMENELSFVEFVRKSQKVPLQEWQSPATEHSDLKVEDLRRGKLEKKAIRAFISYIQSYCSHELTLLFRLKELDIQQLAACYGLSKIPQIRELADKKKKHKIGKPIEKRQPGKQMPRGCTTKTMRSKQD